MFTNAGRAGALAVVACGAIASQAAFAQVWVEQVAPSSVRGGASEGTIVAGAALLLDASGNGRDVLQSGDRLMLGLDQSGTDNLFVLRQSGTGGTVTAVQRGAGNRIQVGQSGSGNVLTAIQR